MPAIGKAALVGLLVVAMGAEANAGRAQTPFYTDKQNLMLYLDGRGRAHPVRSIADWAKRRAHILANMQEVMGPLPGPERRVGLDLAVLDEERLPGLVRKRITYVSEKGDRVPAYLFLPEGRGGKRPAVLCLHQTVAIGKAEPAGLGGSPNLHYALELAQRGYVALAPDYPNFGDYKLDPYALGYVSATMKGIWNHMRAVDLLQTLPEVDRERIGCIGHSLGGHNSLFLAAFDRRIKAVVTSCGFNAFPKYYGGDLTGWSHSGYMPRIASVYARDPGKMPFDFTEVLGAIAPRPVFVNAPLHDDNFELSGVQDCIRAATPVYALFGARPGIVAQHPDSAHDFPPATRQAAYAFLDQVLRWGRRS